MLNIVNLPNGFENEPHETGMNYIDQNCFSINKLNLNKTVILDKNLHVVVNCCLCMDQSGRLGAQGLQTV